MADTKETNPKDAIGTAKVPISTVSAQVWAEVEDYLGRPTSLWVLGMTGIGMMEGGLKYGRHNYRVAGVRASVYYDAVWRHRAARLSGQEIDIQSGLPHSIKEIAGLTVLRDSMLQGNWVDDRPPKAADRELLTGLQAWWEGMDNDCDGHSLITVEIAELVRLAEEKYPIQGADWIDELNEKAASLLIKIPPEKRRPAFTQAGLDALSD